MWLCAGRQTLICAAWMNKVSFKFFAANYLQKNEP